MDTNNSDSGLVTITGAEYARLREIDQGPYTFVWWDDGRDVCAPRRTIEEARKAAEREIAELRWCDIYRGDSDEAYNEILANVRFLVRPRVVHFRSEGGCIGHEALNSSDAQPVKATIDADGSVTIVGP